MPTPALLLSLATLLPLVSFLLLTFAGKRIGTPLAGWIGSAFVLGSFVCSMLAMVSWYAGGQLNGQPWGFDRGPINLPLQWIPIGHFGTPNGVAQDHPGWLDVGIFVDSLTIAMFAMITLVAGVVHLFSVGYMHDDPRYPRFFTYLGLFCFSMLGLVIGGTLLQLLIFWELVGLCSYLLIGFWYEKKSASNAAIKAFITNRVGDVGFLIGLGILVYHLGNVDFLHLWSTLWRANTGGPVTLADGSVFSPALLTVMGVGLFCGAAGKSAQFPLHVWLPDAMEGPTPVSALIHAATMVAAGVYLVGRIFPVLTPDARLVVAIVGCVTLTMAALIAVAQTDIKKVLAYSTLSQLGYMVLGLGVGSWVGGLFHLITHAFFKALLFLGAGSVIHAAGHRQEFGEYGGLIRKIPVTGITFAVAVLAIAGTPFLSGFYSKDMILAHACAFASLAAAGGHSKWYWLLFILPAIVAYITPFYMTRCWMLTFWGKPRNTRLHEAAHEPSVMWIPLVVLAGMTVIAGYPRLLGARELLEASIRENTAACQRNDPAFNGFGQAWPSQEAVAETRAAAEGADPAPSSRVTPDVNSPAADAFEHGGRLVHRYVLWAFLAGIAAGFVVYYNGFSTAAALVKIPPIGIIRRWLLNRMYFDELYAVLLVTPLLAVAKLASGFDRYVVDGIVNAIGAGVRGLSAVVGWSDRRVIDGAVNAVADFTQDLGAAVRAPQTGRIRLYVTMLAAAVAIGMAGVVIGVLTK